MAPLIPELRNRWEWFT